MEKRCGAVVTYWFICRHIRILHGDIILIPLLGVGAGRGAMHRRWSGKRVEPGGAEDHNNLYTAAFIWYTQTGAPVNTLSLKHTHTHIRARNSCSQIRAVYIKSIFLRQKHFTRSLFICFHFFFCTRCLFFFFALYIMSLLLQSLLSPPEICFWNSVFAFAFGNPDFD